MSGYTGNPDAEAEHAAIIAENGIRASQSMIEGPVLLECLECGEEINAERVAFMQRIKMKCVYCVTCQQQHDKPNRIKMLDRIL